MLYAYPPCMLCKYVHCCMHILLAYCMNMCRVVDIHLTYQRLEKDEFSLRENVRKVMSSDCQLYRSAECLVT